MEKVVSGQWSVVSEPTFVLVLTDHRSL